MTQLLGSIFEELGLAQYLDAFIAQGFDTWETILDVTESDLYVGFGLRRIAQDVWNSMDVFADQVFSAGSDALGVKLGHRRVCIVLLSSYAPARHIPLRPPSDDRARFAVPGLI